MQIRLHACCGIVFAQYIQLLFFLATDLCFNCNVIFDVLPDCSCFLSPRTVLLLDDMTYLIRHSAIYTPVKISLVSKVAASDQRSLHAQNLLWPGLLAGFSLSLRGWSAAGSWAMQWQMMSFAANVYTTYLYFSAD